MSAHTMPPLKTFCSKFINSMIHIRSSTKPQKSTTAEVNGYSSGAETDRLTEDDDDENSDVDEDGDAKMTLHKKLLVDSEPATTSEKLKDEKLLKVISKTKVDLQF